MNTENSNDISLEAMRRLPVCDLMKLDMETLKRLQSKADDAIATARRAQFWISGVINFKLGQKA